jgi:hypothetical protein
VATERLPEPALLVMGVLVSSEEALTEVESRVEYMFGPLLRRTTPISFEKFTSYYENEMGTDLLRSYWVFIERIVRGALVEAKLATNRIEREMSIGSKRKVNLDPGLLTPESLVMATTKPYSHRIYISKGVYGELAYRFRKDGGIDLMPWTYPDYRKSTAMDFFSSIRKEVLLS